MKLYMLSVGRLRLDRGAVLTPGVDDGVWVDAPVPVYVVQLGTGAYVLVDTGLNPTHITRPDYLFQHLPEVTSVLQPVMDEEDRLDVQLSRLGLAVADITMVINTHLHYDHCGNNLAFTNCPIVLQRRHYDEALTSNAYFPEQFESDSLSYEFVDGDTDLMPGIRLVVTSGHAFFHQSLLLTGLDSGTVLLCADAICTRDNVTHDTWNVEDVVAARASARRLVRLAEDTGARLVYGHDHRQWSALQAAVAHVPGSLSAGEERG